MTWRLADISDTGLKARTVKEERDGLDYAEMGTSLRRQVALRE